MTTTMHATATVHEPWCSSHVDPNPEEGVDRGWCTSAQTVQDVEIGLTTAEGTIAVDIYSSSDREWTPQEARAVAAEIVRASLVAEGNGGTGAIVAANVVRLIAEATPLDTDALEPLAEILGVHVVALLP